MSVDAVVGVAVDLTPLGAVMSAHADEVVRYCVAKRQPDGTYLCRCGQRWDADLHPIGGS